MSVMHGIEYSGYIDPWTDEERLSDEEIVRCIDCTRCEADEDGAIYCRYDGETIGRALDGLDGFCA